MAGTRILLSIVLLIGTIGSGYAQITSGRIVFERRTNLKKLYADVPEMSRFITEENKIRTEKFELVFNDTASAFLPIEEPGEERGMMSWMTTKNKTYQNLNTKQQMTVLDFAGQQIFVGDSIDPKKWKVTESKRFIGNYHCRKAMYEKNDSTTYYAWFAVELEPSIGPEGVTGLPGAILGLATEDGGIVYFAKEIEVLTPTKEKLSYDIGKNDVYTKESLEKEMEERMGGRGGRWAKGMMQNLFRW